MTPFPIWIFAVLRLLPAVVLTVGFAFIAWVMRSVTAGAALAGLVLTLTLCASAGSLALGPVFMVFLLTVVCTRIGRRRKERFGLAERRQGRTAVQIMANLSVAALCAAPLIFVDHRRYILLAGASAALAEAAGDTVSSELGKVLGGRPWMITTLKRVMPGVDGGITIFGTLAAFAAAMVVCNACGWAGMLLPQYYWPVLLIAFAGTLVDSLLGATLERAGRIGNNAVNYASSAFAAAAGIVAAFLLR